MKQLLILCANKGSLILMASEMSMKKFHWVFEKKKKKVFTIITESTGTHYAFKQSNNLKTNLQWDQQSHLCQ